MTRTAQNNDTQRWVLTHLGGHTYTIQQKSNGRFVDAHEITEKDFARDPDGPEQRHSTVGADALRRRYVHYPAKSNGRFVDAHEITEKDFALVTRTAQNNDTQRWLIKIV